MSVTIQSRSWWTDRRFTARPIAPTRHVFVHHLAGRCSGDLARCLRETEAFHVNSRGYSAIAYSLAADDDQAAIARGLRVAGGHTLGWNSTAHATVACGNYETDGPGDRLVENLAATIIHAIRAGAVTPNPIIGGHRDAPGNSTACPGRHLYARLPAVRALVGRGDASLPSRPDPLPEPRPQLRGADDMFAVESGGDHFLVASTGVSTVTAQTYLRLVATGMPHAEGVNGLEVERWRQDFGARR